jgi:hypothetical protein
MNHSFNIEDAKKYNMTCAVILENIRFWVAKNKANDKHSYDGKYWTYNSIPAFQELFPYMSYDQIRRALAKLVDAGVIEKGNYNENNYDKTAWYSIATSVTENCHIDKANLPHGQGEIATSLIGTDINTDINHIRKDIKHISKDLESNSTTKILGSLDWQKGIALDGEHNSWRFLHRQVKGTHSNVTLPDLQKKCTLFTEQESQGEPKTPFEWSKHFINFCKYQKFTQAKESSLPSATKSDWKK